MAADEVIDAVIAAPDAWRQRVGDVATAGAGVVAADAAPPVAPLSPTQLRVARLARTVRSSLLTQDSIIIMHLAAKWVEEKQREPGRTR